MKLPLLTLGIVLAILSLAGCAPRPVIKGHHWSYDTLYDERGAEAASVVYAPFNGTQVCIRENANFCQSFENSEAAYKFLADFYAKRDAR